MKKTRKMRNLGETGKTGVRRRSLAALFLTLGAATFPTWPGFSLAPASARERGLAVVAKNRIEAILVGVDEYASRNVETLTYAGADAKKLRDALTKIGVPEESVRLFVSRGGLRERPDKATIMAALDEAVKNSGPSSTILVALSGHGFETPDGEAAFCPEDAKISVSGVEVYVDKDSAILISEVAEKLRSDDAKFKLLIVDACRAPAGARTTNGRRSFVTGDASGLAFLQSCSSGESSWEDESVEGGLFTHYFVEGLTGAAADEEGGVSFLGVCDYAARRTKARARALRNASQTPFHRMSGTNFYLVEPSGTRSGGESATAATLFTEAFQAFSAKDYATAKSKCEASLAASRTAAEKAAARNLMAMIEEAQKPQTGGTTGTQTSTAQSQPQRPTSQTLTSSTPQPPPSSGDWFGPHAAGTAKTLKINGLDYRFHYCPPGTFTMGGPASERAGVRYDHSDETQHKVELTNGFWMLETEVTQAMWESVKGKNPSYFSAAGGGSSKVSGLDTSNFPVECVSWEDCQDFIEELNSLGIAPEGFQFRLPTEAEWEYACRAGTTTPYFWGSSLNGDKANCCGSSPYGTSSKGKFWERTTQVGSYDANGWGLYDMHGNVWEWCEDLYTPYKNVKNVQNPVNVASGSNRVVRGGGWPNDAKSCRSAQRRNIGPTGWDLDCGFRLVLTSTIATATERKAVREEGEEDMRKGVRELWEELKPKVSPEREEEAREAGRIPLV